MKQFVLGIATAGAMAGVVALSRSEIDGRNRSRRRPERHCQIEAGDKNPGPR